MSQRTQGLLVNALVAVGVIALLHVFFVAVPSRLAERSAPGPLALPAEALPAGAGPTGAGPAEVSSAPASPAGAGAVPVSEIVAEPVHGPSGMAPGILAAPDRN